MWVLLGADLNIAIVLYACKIKYEKYILKKKKKNNLAGHCFDARHLGAREFRRWWRQWSSSTQEVCCLLWHVTSPLPTLSAVPNALGSWTLQKKGTQHSQGLIFRGETRGMNFFFQKMLLVQSVATEQWNHFELSFLSFLLNLWFQSLWFFSL